ncbi:hypothetical protein Tco_0810589, partial [Tanacetum coccineum]
ALSVVVGVAWCGGRVDVRMVADGVVEMVYG